MPDLRVRRTLVKSPPELWAELSEVEGLERHLGAFGEIRITRAEPESAVAWEGEDASGTVELEPTGWGTKVTITAAVAQPEHDEPEPGAFEPEPAAPEPEPAPVGPDPEPAAATPESGPFDPDPDPFDPEPTPEPKRRGFFARWLYRERRGVEPVPAQPAQALRKFPEADGPQWEAAPQAQSAPEPEPPAPAPQDEPAQQPAADSITPDDDADFEFDFVVRRGGEQLEPEEPRREPLAPERAREVLEAALENLGQAHHRPFSRG